MFNKGIVSKDIFKKVLICTAFVAFVGVAPADAAEKKQDKKEAEVSTYELLNLFGDVFERVRVDYVEEVSDKELLEAAVNGMLTSLDPHSSYLDAKNFKDMQVHTRGRFGGLGIEVTMEHGLVKVVSPIDDTPAYRAGIKPGDYITHIDGKPVLGLTLSEAVDKMRGRVSTDILVTIRRKNQKPFDVTITRAIIKIHSVRSRIEDESVGYIRITSFNESTDTGVEKAIAKIKQEAGDKLLGYVIDLRNNPGGLLDQAINVSDIFLDKGEIVSTRSRHAADTQRYNAKLGDLAEGKPIVVIINNGSASASEIVAGALQDHRRAILIGTRSFGKGSVQTIVPLQGVSSGAMRLTTARYYTPSGRSIQAKGIEPDIEVKLAKIEEIDLGYSVSEAELRNALVNEDDKKSKKNKGKKADNDDGKEENQDYQLIRAKDLLRGLSLFAKSGMKLKVEPETEVEAVESASNEGVKK
ncbi:MAG: S41 family peptidase [Alphaproteobacteria bacterium]|nr:S41 family peptidase [Alphaproteobacteria bacterium]